MNTSALSRSETRPALIALYRHEMRAEIRRAWRTPARRRPPSNSAPASCGPTIQKVLGAANRSIPPADW